MCIKLKMDMGNILKKQQPDQEQITVMKLTKFQTKKKMTNNFEYAITICLLKQQLKT